MQGIRTALDVEKGMTALKVAVLDSWEDADDGIEL
jgi:hypothetical protein